MTGTRVTPSPAAGVWPATPEGPLAEAGGARCSDGMSGRGHGHSSSRPCHGHTWPADTPAVPAQEVVTSTAGNQDRDADDCPPPPGLERWPWPKSRGAGLEAWRPVPGPFATGNGAGPPGQPEGAWCPPPTGHLAPGPHPAVGKGCPLCRCGVCLHVAPALLDLPVPLLLNLFSDKSSP